MTKKEVLTILKENGNPKVAEQMKHFGINTPKAFGNKTPLLRSLKKQIGTDHRLALSLWKTGYHEARVVAAFVADTNLVTTELMEMWVNDFDSWAICDTCCSELFCYTSFAIQKSYEWSNHEKEFVKRAGFVLMTELAVHIKQLDDKTFTDFFPVIIRESTDERNFVRKGVNWSLRQIGKRNIRLNKIALSLAVKLSKEKNSTTRWIGKDAIKDLTSQIVQRRVTKELKKRN